MSENLGLYDRATRAAVVLLVYRGVSPQRTAEVIHMVAKPVLGGASKVSRWARYGAHACQASATNRQWKDYGAMKALAHKIANAAEALL